MRRKQRNGYEEYDMLFVTTTLHFSVVLSAFRLRDVQGVDSEEVNGVQGHNATLPCVMKETKETASQISWQKATRKNPQNHDFFTINKQGPLFFNGDHSRFVFIGSRRELNGSMQIINVTVEDEGLYTCIFTLFPSGNVDKKIHLFVIVPPVTSVTPENVVLGHENVAFATCTAANSKPPARVKWLIEDLKGVEATISSTSHPNGTTTTVSTLAGTPTQDMNGQPVQCLITFEAPPKEEALSSRLIVNFPPMSMNISSRGPDSVECSTVANPVADYTWSRSEQPLTESVRVDGPTLTFLSKTSDLNGIYLCQASNRYGSKVGQIYVHFQSGPCSVSWALFGIIVTVFALIAAAAAFEMYCFRCTHFRRFFDYRGPDIRLPQASPPRHEHSSRAAEEMVSDEGEPRRDTTET